MTIISKQTIGTPYQEPEDGDYRLGAGTRPSDGPDVFVNDVVSGNGLLEQVRGESVGTQFSSHTIDSGEGGTK